MKKENNHFVLCLFGILPVVWLGLLIAPAAHGGLPEIIARFPAVMNAPFHIELCGDSLKTVFVLLSAYGLAVGVILCGSSFFLSWRSLSPWDCTFC